MDTDYLSLVKKAFEKIEDIQQQREKLDAEFVKLEQFITATANFLPDEHRNLAMRLLKSLGDLQRARDFGLTESIRAVLRTEGDWLTTSQVRDRLDALAFDFSVYTTNPLASISTTLRRMKEEEVESKTNDDGVAVYRWKDKTERLRKMAVVKQWAQLQK